VTSARSGIGHTNARVVAGPVPWRGIGFPSPADGSSRGELPAPYRFAPDELGELAGRSEPAPLIEPLRPQVGLPGPQGQRWPGGQGDQALEDLASYPDSLVIGIDEHHGDVAPSRAWLSPSPRCSRNDSATPMPTNCARRSMRTVTAEGSLSFARTRSTRASSGSRPSADRARCQICSAASNSSTWAFCLPRVVRGPTGPGRTRAPTEVLVGVDAHAGTPDRDGIPDRAPGTQVGRGPARLSRVYDERRYDYVHDDIAGG